MTYNNFKNQAASEKLTLAILQASKRLMAWSLHSGSVYKLTNFDIFPIVNISDSNIEYTEVSSLAAITTSTYFNDRDNKILYLKTSASDNPNSRFISLTYKLFFSNIPITLPHDLNTGDEVYFEPMIKATSTFGVEIDTYNQTSDAIEGSGSLTLHNDNDFWVKNYDKLIFENKECLIYSHNRDLEPTEAKLLFKGFVEKRSYSKESISFNLKDLMSQLKNAVKLNNIEDLGLRHATDLAKAKQRMVIGRVFGHRPTNLDEVNNGYLLSGTVSIGITSKNVIGSGTSFVSKLSPGDKLVLGGKQYTITEVTDNTSLKVSQSYSGASSLVAVPLLVIPEDSKRYINRKWLVAGHPTRQPITYVEQGSSVSRLNLNSTKDIYDGDTIYIGEYGSGQTAVVSSVAGSRVVNLNSSLLYTPPNDTPVFKPSIQNVRINDKLLTYDRDYTYNATTGILTLDYLAEYNVSDLQKMSTSLVFNSDFTVTGKNLDSLLKPGDFIGGVGHSEMFEIASIESDTSLTLRTTATYNHNGPGLVKKFIFKSGDVLTCDILGRTVDGTASGELIDIAPKAIKALLKDMGLETEINNTSFSNANDLCPHPIGLVIPQKYNDKNSATYRDVFNKINQSVLSSLVQDNGFKFSYLVLSPFKDVQTLRLDEADILNLSVESRADKVVKNCIVKYKQKEYDYLTKNNSVEYSTKTSDLVTYIVKSEKEKTVETILINESDASAISSRLSFMLENATTNIKVTTKLQAIELEVGSIVEISHRKIYQRNSSTNSRKLAMVESIKKNGSLVDIELVDLSGAFNRCGVICLSEQDWANSDDLTRLYSGYFTDQYGLIDNDINSFGLNLIW